MESPKLENLMEKCGFIKCQIEISDYILTREKEIFERIKEKHQLLNNEPSMLKRQEVMIELAQLTGESMSLKAIWNYVSGYSSCSRQSNPA